MLNGQETVNKNAERFSEHLENTFRPNQRHEEEHRWEEPLQTDEIIIPASTKEEAVEIKENIKSDKAPGNDLITGTFYKTYNLKPPLKFQILECCVLVKIRL